MTSAGAWSLRICSAPGDNARARQVIDVAGGDGSVDLCVLADGPRALRFDLRYRDPDYRTEPKAVFWAGWFVFGFGGRVVLLPEQGGAAVEVDLGCYFSDFLADGDYLLVTSGQGVVRLDRDAAIVWRNDALGLDGVIIFDIEDGLIDGQGEWDPPDGWRDFLISLETGETVDDA
jgi:hypothetical protein